VHCVQAQGAMLDLLARMKKRHGTEQWQSINIDLHSFGGSAESIKALIKGHPKNVFFSFSTTINIRSPRLVSLVQAVPPDRLLLESDWNSPIGCSEKLWEIYDMVKEAKDWDDERATTQLERNWQLFSRSDASNRSQMCKAAES